MAWALPAFAVLTSADNGDVRQVDPEPAIARQPVDELLGLGRPEIPSAATRRTVEMTMFVRGQEVVFLVPIRTVRVANEAQELEDIQGPIDGRGRRQGVDFPAAPQDLDTAQMPLAARQDVDQGAALRRPAQSSCAKQVTDALPGAGC